MKEHPNRNVTNRELFTAIGADYASEVSNAVNQLVKRRPEMQWVTRGIYRWNDNGQHAENDNGQHAQYAEAVTMLALALADVATAIREQTHKMTTLGIVVR